MDITQIDNLLGWIVGFFITSGATMILSFISIYRAGKLLPKELKGAELDNRMKEADLALKMEGAADRALEKSEIMRGRLNSLEDKYCILEDKIKELNEIIVNQSIRITAQELEISTLICELGNSKIYTNALISQMKQSSIIPVEMESLEVKDCSKLEIPKKTRKK